MTIIARAFLKNTTPLSMSKFIPPEKNPKETHDDYEKRIWQKRLHYNQKTGEVEIPPMMFKNCLSESAKFLSISIPGKGKSTYTKHFEAGVICVSPMPIGVQWDQVPCDVLHVPSDGRRGGSTRVIKHFPRIDSWEGTAEFYVVDETITKPVFERVLREAGNLIGLGRFRPRNNGYYGRFSVESLEWEAQE